MQSCHTGVSADGYFFEGHIPAKFVTAFLANPPENAAGLAVPGMPAGSPGMEMGDRFNPYSVILVKKDGTTEVYATPFVRGPRARLERHVSRFTC